MGELSKDMTSGLGGVFARVGEFFHLFDLSFFVSGAASMSAIAYWYSRQSIRYEVASATWLRVLVVIVACYVAGLISFSAGRLLAGLWRRRFGELFDHALHQQRIEDAEVKWYVQHGAQWRLYERLWADLRESPTHGASFGLLNRYWVMSATYDGVAVSCIVWALVLLEEPIVSTANANTVLSLLCVTASGLCFRQGFNYFCFQVYEMAATLASSRGRILR